MWFRLEVKSKPSSAFWKPDCWKWKSDKIEFTFKEFNNSEIIANRNFSNILHLFLILGTSIFFVMNHSIFRFKNMQYEIREFIFVYAFFFWFIHCTSKLKREALLQKLQNWNSLISKDAMKNDRIFQ